VKKIKIIIFVTIVLYLSQSAIAQTTLRSNITSLNESELKDTTGNFQLNRLSIGFSTTLYSKVSPDEEQFNALMFSANTSVSKVQLSPYLSSFNNLALQTGLTYLFHSKQKNTLLISVSPFLSTSRSKISESRLNFFGFTLFNRKVNNYWDYRVGAIYINTFHDQIALPLLGFQYKINSDNKIECFLPFRFSYTRNHSKKNESHISIGFNGFVSQTNLAATPEITLRLRQFLCTYTFLQKTNKNFQWFATAGITANRRLNLIHNPTEFTNEQVKSGLYLQVGISYRFLKNNTKNTSFESDIFDFQNISIDDIIDSEYEK
jgi:hypothetical protein